MISKGGNLVALVEAACNLQSAIDGDGDAHRVLMDDIEEHFREGPLPRPDADAM
jgi:hypothetical protein